MMGDRIWVFHFFGGYGGARYHLRLLLPIQMINHSTLIFSDSNGKPTKVATTRVKNSTYKLLIYSNGRSPNPDLGLVDHDTFKKQIAGYSATKNLQKGYYIIRYNGDGQPMNFKKKDQLLSIFFPRVTIESIESIENPESRLDND